MYNLWYLATPSASVQRSQMLAVTILGQPVVIVRPEHGVPYALRDLCPHRGIPLSYGRLCEGRVECAYHGWQFDAAGVCQHIPSLVDGQKLDCTHIKVKTYPCAEVQGNIWVYMPDNDHGRDHDQAPDISHIPVFEAERLKAPNYTLRQIFPCNYDHAIVGLMDPAHGPFVHQSWWWRKQSSIHAKEKAFAPTTRGFKMVRHKPSSNAYLYKLLGGTPETEIEFALPGVRIERIWIGGHRVLGLTTITPIDETQSLITHSLYWTMGYATLLKPLIAYLANRFLSQDRDAVTKQAVGLRHSPPLMLIDDADKQAKWYYRLKKAHIEATQGEGEFVNPVRATTLKWRS